MSSFNVERRAKQIILKILTPWDLLLTTGLSEPLATLEIKILSDFSKYTKHQESWDDLISLVTPQLATANMVLNLLLFHLETKETTSIAYKSGR